MLGKMKKMLRHLNENAFVLLFVFGLAGLVLIGPVSPDLYLIDLLVIKMLKVAIFLVTTFGLVYFLRDTQYDVMREIFDEHNTSAAVLVVGLLLAIGVAVS